MADPILVVDPASRIPPYEQICDGLRSLIAAGSLSAGDQLPSVRQLARDLDVAANTVVKAYAVLHQEGWILPAKRQGFRVAPEVGQLIPNERSRQLEGAARRLLETADQLGADLSEVYAVIKRIDATRLLRPPASAPMSLDPHGNSPGGTPIRSSD